jgi:Icc-related predicted phosphoesterase
MRKLWHISDTHTYHKLLTVPADVHLVVFSGDCSNPRDPVKNEREVRDFIAWFGSLSIKHKIFVAGNHDTSIEKGLITREDFEEAGITYLENDYITIDGIKIFGSPFSPTFGQGWAFNKDRSQLDDYWAKIDADTDIVITHSPPKTILDVAYHKGEIDHCGCNALKKHILGRIKPSLCLFGHIHNSEDVINAGVIKLSAFDTVFSNGSVVTDNKFGIVTSNGNIMVYS